MRSRGGLRVSVCCLGQRALADGGGCRGSGGVEVLGESSAEVDDGASRIDGDAGEESNVLAAVGICGQMRDGGVGEENERECGNLSRRRESLC